MPLLPQLIQLHVVWDNIQILTLLHALHVSKARTVIKWPLHTLKQIAHHSIVLKDTCAIPGLANIHLSHYSALLGFIVQEEVIDTMQSVVVLDIIYHS